MLAVISQAELQMLLACSQGCGQLSVPTHITVFHTLGSKLGIAWNRWVRSIPNEGNGRNAVCCLSNFIGIRTRIRMLTDADNVAS